MINKELSNIAARYDIRSILYSSSLKSSSPSISSKCSSFSLLKHKAKVLIVYFEQPLRTFVVLYFMPSMKMTDVLPCDN